MLLSEAQSKSNYISGVPLLPSIASELFKVYLAKGVFATTTIEGNTLTEEEVRQRLEGKLKLPRSKEYLGQEVDNIVEACNLIASAIIIIGGHSTKLSVEELQNYNRLVLKALPLEEHITPGEIRTYRIGVGRYLGAPAEDLEYLLKKLCDWLDNEFAPEDYKDYKTAFGILKAILAHIYMVWIHPFGDGNGRTARLIEFQIMLSVGVPATAAQLLSNHYNITRTEYYRQLDRMHRTSGDILPFIEYAFQGLVDGLDEQIQVIQQQQLYVHWVNYIHNSFRTRDKPTDIRRRRLILDLSDRQKPVPIPISEVRYVSTRVAEAYAGLSQKTVQRDINKLAEMGLLIKTAEGVRDNREVMLRFRSPTRFKD